MQDATTSLMIETLQDGLSQLRGRRVRILELRREPVLDPSSFHTERLKALLDGNEWLPVFFKDLNPQRQPEQIRRVRGGDLSLSRRELLMYRSVLSRDHFGTPRLYAFRWEPSRAIFWLFLEDAGSLTLDKCGDFKCWIAAAEWAARFHAAVRQLPASRINFLPALDRSHYLDCARRVQRRLPDFEVGDRLLIARALQEYVPLIDWFCDQPRNLIHGELFGSNIVLRSGDAEQMIAVVDWQSAAIGLPAVDLVALTAGGSSAQQSVLLRQVYFEQYRSDTGLDLDWENFSREFGAVALYHALSWIARWPGKEFAAQLSRWIAELKLVVQTYYAAG